eukprot:1176542-Prorocentrum_minimum.AAC.5
MIEHLLGRHGELGERVDGALLRLVLHRLAAAHDVDGGVGLGVEVRLDERLLLVAAVLAHLDAIRRHLGRERLVLRLHRLAELAPGGVHHHNGLLGGVLHGEQVRLAGNLLHRGGLGPEVAVEGLLRARHVDAALGLLGAILEEPATQQMMVCYFCSGDE